jgi:hypothetical protein
MRVGLDSATKPHTAVAAAGMGRLSQSQRRKMPTHCVASGQRTVSLATLTAV